MTLDDTFKEGTKDRLRRIHVRRPADRHDKWAWRVSRVQSKYQSAKQDFFNIAFKWRGFQRTLRRPSYGSSWVLWPAGRGTAKAEAGAEAFKDEGIQLTGTIFAPQWREVRMETCECREETERKWGEEERGRRELAMMKDRKGGRLLL